MRDRKKQIIISIIVFLLIITAFSISRAAYINYGVMSNNELIVGDIYMHYLGSSEIQLDSVIPSNTFDPNLYFEFTVDGINTTTNKNIVYSINISHGANHPTKTIRLADEFLRFRLVEVNNNVETVLVAEKEFSNINDSIIYVETIPYNTNTEVTHTYRLYPWVTGVMLGNTDLSNYTTAEWSQVYATIDVGVRGDFENKVVPVETKLVLKNLYADTNWSNIRNSVTSIEFSRDSTVPANAVTSFDVTDSTSAGPVTLYTLDDGLGNNTYKVVICGDGYIYAPEDSTHIFRNMAELVTFDSRNFRVDDVRIMRTFFANNPKLTNIETLYSWNTSNVEDMVAMFQNNTQLTNINALANWNTENVENLQNMFSGCTNLVSVNALSNWNVGSVTNFVSLFYNCTNLTNISGLANWNTENVESLQNLFAGCTNLSNIDALIRWNVGDVSNMSYLFYGTAITNVNALSNWNVASVENMGSTFGNCTNLSDISGLANWNVGIVSDMSYLFYETAIANVNALSAWNVSNVETMRSLFSRCYSLIDVNGLANWGTKTGNVKNMNFLFGIDTGNFKINNTPIDFSALSNWNVSNVTDMGSMFQNINIPSYQPFASWNVGKVENFSDMFNQTDDSTVTSLAGLENWNVVSAKNMSNMFCENRSLTDASAINNWAIKSSIDFTKMFKNCHVHPAFTQVAGTWNAEGTFTPS